MNNNISKFTSQNGKTYFFNSEKMSNSEKVFESSSEFKKERRRDNTLSMLSLVSLSILIGVLGSLKIDGSIKQDDIIPFILCTLMVAVLSGILISLLMIYVIKKIFNINDNGFSYIKEIYLKGYFDGCRDTQESESDKLN